MLCINGRYFLDNLCRYPASLDSKLNSADGLTQCLGSQLGDLVRTDDWLKQLKLGIHLRQRQAEAQRVILSLASVDGTTNQAASEAAAIRVIGCW